MRKNLKEYNNNNNNDNNNNQPHKDQTYQSNNR